MAQQTISSLRDLLDQRQRALDNTRNLLTAAHEEAAQLRAAHMAEADQLSRRARELADANARLTEQLAQQQQQLARTQQQLDQQRQEHQLLATQHAQAQRQQPSAAPGVEQLVGHLKEVEAAAQQQRQLASELGSKLAAAEARVAELERDKAQLEQQLADARNRPDAPPAPAAADPLARHSEVASLQQASDRLRAELAALRSTAATDKARRKSGGSHKPCTNLSKFFFFWSFSFPFSYLFFLLPVFVFVPLFCCEWAGGSSSRAERAELGVDAAVAGKGGAAVARHGGRLGNRRGRNCPHGSTQGERGQGGCAGQ